MSLTHRDSGADEGGLDIGRCQAGGVVVNYHCVERGRYLDAVDPVVAVDAGHAREIVAGEWAGETALELDFGHLETRITRAAALSGR